MHQKRIESISRNIICAITISFNMQTSLYLNQIKFKWRSIMISDSVFKIAPLELTVLLYNRFDNLSFWLMNMLQLQMKLVRSFITKGERYSHRPHRTNRFDNRIHRKKSKSRKTNWRSGTQFCQIMAGTINWISWTTPYPSWSNHSQTTRKTCNPNLKSENTVER